MEVTACIENINTHHRNYQILKNVVQEGLFYKSQTNIIENQKISFSKVTKYLNLAVYPYVVKVLYLLKI
jgi:hypothetical protein